VDLETRSQYVQYKVMLALAAVCAVNVHQSAIKLQLRVKYKSLILLAASVAVEVYCRRLRQQAAMLADT
jgi:predicted transport protein